MSSKLTYLGHATVLIEIQGLRLLTDPLLQDQLFHLSRNAMSIPPSVYENIDAVLISHLHHDHCHLPSLRQLPADTLMIVPSGSGATFHQWGFRNVEEIQVNEVRKLGDVSIEATFALHSGFRPPLGPTTSALGFMINGEDRIYFAGDTDIFSDMSQFASNLDIALLPIWGWGPTLGRGHLDPYRAAKALELLKPTLAIPIHWGTFQPMGTHWMKPAFMTIPPIEFEHHAKQLMPNIQICVLKPGQSLDV